MSTIVQTETFTRWEGGLRDARARKKIGMRIQLIADGSFGDHKWFGKIGELRIHYGPGYRVYFTRRAGEIVILLCGGDKTSQREDIDRAERLAAELT